VKATNSPSSFEVTTDSNGEVGHALAQPEPAWTEQEVRCGPWAFGSSDARFGYW
jgi:hypothetical protein